MRYAGLNKNDEINGVGICVSLWMQGCPHRCFGCHNPETWSQNCGKEIEWKELKKEIFSAITANGIQRNFSILGGEPLVPYNREYTFEILKEVKQKFPSIKTCVWTGYEQEELSELFKKKAFKNIDYLIIGRYEKKLRDVTLKWRGSSNQKILIKNINY